METLRLGTSTRGKSTQKKGIKKLLNFSHLSIATFSIVSWFSEIRQIAISSQFRYCAWWAAISHLKSRQCDGLLSLTSSLDSCCCCCFALACLSEQARPSLRAINCLVPWGTKAIPRVRCSTLNGLEQTERWGRFSPTPYGVGVHPPWRGAPDRCRRPR